MTQLSGGVAEMVDSPAPESDVELIVGVTDTTPRIKNAIRNTGGTITRELPCDYLAVEIAETDLDALSQIEFVETIEIDGTGRVLATGNQ